MTMTKKQDQSNGDQLGVSRHQLTPPVHKSTSTNHTHQLRKSLTTSHFYSDAFPRTCESIRDSQDVS